jgi:hypothetical protein
MLKLTSWTLTLEVCHLPAHVGPVITQPLKSAVKVDSSSSFTSPFIYFYQLPFCFLDANTVCQNSSWQSAIKLFGYQGVILDFLEICVATGDMSLAFSGILQSSSSRDDSSNSLFNNSVIGFTFLLMVISIFCSSKAI